VLSKGMQRDLLVAVDIIEAVLLVDLLYETHHCHLLQQSTMSKMPSANESSNTREMCLQFCVQQWLGETTGNH
jgi:hypothetical protein